jgi:hypothetical protein
MLSVRPAIGRLFAMARMIDFGFFSKGATGCLLSASLYTGRRQIWWKTHRFVLFKLREVFDTP